MTFASVAPAIKEQVISAYLSGKGKNQIDREFHKAGIIVSRSSIGNIINRYEQSKSANKTVVRQDRNPSIKQETDQNPAIHRRDGGPFAHLVNEDTTLVSNTSTDVHEHESSSVNIPLQITTLPESIFAEAQVNNTDNSNITDSYDTSENETPQKEDFEQSKIELALRGNSHKPSDKQAVEIDFEDSDPDYDSGRYMVYRPEPEPEPEPEFEINEQTNLGIDYDSQSSFERRLFKELLLNKKQRRQEFQLIEQQKQELAQIMQKIEQRENDLKNREMKVMELEQLAPTIRNFQDIGLTFDLVIPYTMTVNEKAAAENLDFKTAAWNIIKDFENYRLVGGLSRNIDYKKQQIAALENLDIQRQRAIITLITLEQAGFTDGNIIDLVTYDKSIDMWKLNNGHTRRLDDKLIGVSVASKRNDGRG